MTANRYLLCAFFAIAVGPIAGKAGGDLVGLVYNHFTGRCDGDVTVTWGEDGPYRVHPGEAAQPVSWPNPKHICKMTDTETHVVRFATPEGCKP